MAIYRPDGMSAGGVGLQKNHEPPEIARRVSKAASDRSKFMIIREFMAMLAWRTGRFRILELFEPSVKRGKGPG